MEIRNFIRICKIRVDPDAYRKALHAIEAFVEGDENRAHDIMQGSGKDVDTSVWIRRSA